MKIQRFMLLFQNHISKLREGVLLAVGCMLIMSSCSTKQEKKTEVSSTFPVNITEPVNRDLAEIRNSGVLRMITSYSSGSYFLHRGIQVGFEYELLKKFTEENDLALEVVIVSENKSPYDMLNSGQGDIIASNYTVTRERDEVVDFTRPYNLVDQIIVVSEDLGIEPESISDMEGIPISVRRNSSYYVRLKELQEEGFPVSINIIPDDMDTESVLFQVASGMLEATVADDNIYEASSRYMRGLVQGPYIAEGDTIAWAIRENAPDLETQLNKFLYKHFRFDENGIPKRSAFLNILRKKYFKGGNQIAEYFSPEYQSEQYGTISPYDEIIQRTAHEYGIDWVMLTAIAAQESKFDASSVSWAGAVGVMQVLPRFSEISIDSLYLPEVNIKEGARILSEHLKHYAYMDSTNKWAFALATYNAGSGHIADARRLAIDHNDDPNQWVDVSESLLRLMQRKYYQNARYGFCRGIETVRYVNEIMNRYETYQAILALSNNRAGSVPGVFGIKTLNTP